MHVILATTNTSKQRNKTYKKIFVWKQARKLWIKPIFLLLVYFTFVWKFLWRNVDIFSKHFIFHAKIALNLNKNGKQHFI